MRDSLKRSAEHTPAQGFERYPKGSIVLCNACALPVFKLDRGIDFGDKCGQTATAFKPLSVVDLAVLGERQDIDSGVRARVRAMTMDQRVAHVGKLKEMHTGDPMLCPVCLDCFVQVVSIDKNEVLDRSYTVELVTIPLVYTHGTARAPSSNPGFTISCCKRPDCGVAEASFELPLSPTELTAVTT